MTTRKVGVYLSQPLEALLADRKDQGSLSGRLSVVAERYAEIIDDNRPDLTEPEWNACYDALNGVWLRDTEALRFIWAEIADADQFDDLGKKWGIDARALAGRVRRMRPAELISFVEAVEKWWSEQ